MLIGEGTGEGVLIWVYVQVKAQF